MMLSDNIKKYRKANNMSQDELAQRLNVSRQSVSLWENGQSQPTIDNIIALTKIFGISSDELLDNIPDKKEESVSEEKRTDGKSNHGKAIVLGVIIGVVVSVAVALICVFGIKNNNESTDTAVLAQEAEIQTTDQPQIEEKTTADGLNASPSSTTDYETNQKDNTEVNIENKASAVSGQASAEEEQVEDFDLFEYCKNFAIQKGELNGDFSIYQQPSSRYGGYDNEYFSISYWGDSDMVEFCLHCPLDDTLSINFYLRMRGGYDGKYEYLSSKYYRSDGSSLRCASGYIDPSEFSEKYPLNCNNYDGSSDGQNEFMEESRVGMCDLIKCLKQFVKVENMDCDFSDFEFENF